MRTYSLMMKSRSSSCEVHSHVHREAKSVSRVTSYLGASLSLGLVLLNLWRYVSSLMLYLRSIAALTRSYALALFSCELRCELERPAFLCNVICLHHPFKSGQIGLYVITLSEPGQFHSVGLLCCRAAAGLSETRHCRSSICLCMS